VKPLIGRTLGHYRIVDKIGAGGMGEVYRAHDERLDRDVAIKVLPEEVAADSDRLRRFEREAKAVATLSHSNILEIFDFDHDGEVSFSVTELLEGETLQEHLQKERGLLPWRRVQEIGAAVADGLGAAHGKGVVHRDIKPSNIFLCSDGRVKILDFGLAATHDVVDTEAVTGSFEAPLTQEGRVLGTVGYMAPEQVRGEPADHRSDVFALGCVLYEMVSGRRAFARDTAAETMAAILNEEPADISTSGTAFPAELAGTVRRCLEKRAESRFQSANDLAYTLRTVSGASAFSDVQPVSRTGGWRRVAPWAVLGVVIVVALVLTAVVRGRLSEKGSSAPPDLSPNRVAVVPMENRTGDPSLDMLGHLAADLIMQRFTETGAAEVVPLAETLQDASSARLKGAQTPGWTHVLQLARERGAGLVLGGAYYLDGDTLRLQARLVDAATGELIYAFEPVAATRDATAEGMIVLGERVLAGVAAHVNVLDIDISVMKPPSTYDAFQAFKRGRELFGPNWPEAIVQFHRALELDPDFHYARIETAWSYINLNDFDDARREVSVLEEQVDRLTAYERTYVQYMRSFLDWDRSAALNALRRMLQLAPKMPWLRSEIAFRALELNRPGEAVKALEACSDLQNSDEPDDTAWWPLMKMTAAHHMLGHYERELEYAELGLENFPGVAPFYLARLRALAAMGQVGAVDKVIGDFLRVQTRGGSAGGLMSTTVMELRAHGHREEADEMAVRSLKWYESHPLVRPEDSGAFTIELWMLGYPEESRSFANALWVVGRWDDLENLIVQLIEKEPSEHQLAGWLGVVAAIRGDNAEAMRISDELPVGDSLRDGAWGTYWQASIAAHLGEKDRAVKLLAEAFSKGYPYGFAFHNSMEFEPLWDYPPFQELIEPKG